jgi:hypothetical protein
MHFAAHVGTWRVARLCSVQWNSAVSETILNRTNVHTHILLRMTDTMTSHITDLSSWDVLYGAHIEDRMLCSSESPPSPFFWEAYSLSPGTFFFIFYFYIACLFLLILLYIIVVGARGSVVVKALCCKPEGRGFKSRWGGFFKLT